MHKKKIVAYLLAAIWLLVQTAAHSAGLGKLTINSALGQPVSAQIEIIATDPAELANLHAHMASEDAFQKANLDFNSTVSSIKFSIDKNSNGGVVLKLTSDRPVNDPFIDMLVELDWGNGQMVREYTLLLDPPGMKENTNNQNNNLPTTSAAVSANSGSDQSVPTQQQSAKAATVAAVEHRVVKRVPKPESASTGTIPANQSTPDTRGPIKRGETLTEIAQQTKPEGIRLEQMLVGLYRENAQAFDGNMNRLKTGHILKIPSKDAIAAISETAAVREVHLQAADWQSYRQKLAGEVAAAPKVKEKSTQASGKIASAVEDQAAPGKTGQDILKLSKGEIPAGNKKIANGTSAKAAKLAGPNAAEQKQMAQDDAVARQKALKEANDRTAVLQKNIQQMQKLVELKNAALAAAQSKAAQPVPVKPAVIPVATVEKLVKPIKPKMIKPVPPMVEPNSWYADINPLYIGVGAVALLLIALLGFMSKSRHRREGLSKFENSILTNVDPKPNTVYGTQGGASVNTNNTSFLTDFSQSGLGTLDTHDVDPIAEAEVYMAYGRDAQAEEILKEAMLKDPERHEIKLKLLEIYAARNNLPAFESIATELYSTLGNESNPVWEKAAELGRKLDPKNPLYGGQAVLAPVYASVPVVAASVVDDGEDRFRSADMPAAISGIEPIIEDQPEVHDKHNLDFPTAMDFDIEMTPVHSMPEQIEAVGIHKAVKDTAENELIDIDLFAFEHVDGAVEAVVAAPAAAEFEASAPSHDDGLSFDFDLDGLHEIAHPPVVFTPPALIAPADDTIVLDFSGIDLNMDTAATEDAALSDAEQEIKTKFELAQVYQEMGDYENAREILQEVIVEGDSRQQASAQALLQQLG